MTRDPISAEEDTSIKEAMLLLRTNHIRHLPVTTGRVLVGMVSDRDIRLASPSLLSGIAKADYEQVLEDTPISRIMTREPFTVVEDTALVDAVKVLVEKKVGGLPVVNGKELVGIFTQVDALKILLRSLNGGG